MTRQVDLIWLGDEAGRPFWNLGDVWPTEPTPAAIHKRVSEKLRTSQAEAWLFWDSNLGLPDPERVNRALASPGDLWHMGLRLGMAGLPGIIDFVAPTWMLNRDPAPDIEATSWRLSLRACLVRTEALEQLGSVNPEFQTLEGASLEMGHRYVSRGALPRHLPWLAKEPASATPAELPFEDELLFASRRFGRLWARFALLRALLTGYVSMREGVRAWRSLSKTAPSEMPVHVREDAASSSVLLDARVSVLIPTLDRYGYLRTVLGQLRDQTVSPVDILVVDQTPIERRDTSIAGDFGDLPLKVMYRDRPGQCTSRNAGLRAAEGDYVLFIDDDDEVRPELIEAHLVSLRRFRAEVSCGIAHEAGAGPLPEMFTYTRASDVFPTNNTLIQKSVLQRSGLFDLAYDRGQRADGDLGMRVYLSGALMVLNADISVLHHHAPSGGLRAHKARVVTYASSRTSLTHRQLPSATEIYLAMRYFTTRQLREDVLLKVVGTMAVRGGLVRKSAKIIIGLLRLPSTLWETRRRYLQATAMLRNYPRIPRIADSALGLEPAPVAHQAIPSLPTRAAGKEIQ